MALAGGIKKRARSGCAIPWRRERKPRAVQVRRSSDSDSVNFEIIGRLAQLVEVRWRHRKCRGYHVPGSPMLGRSRIRLSGYVAPTLIRPMASLQTSVISEGHMGGGYSVTQAFLHGGRSSRQA
jgi:hypothetical protein